MFKKRVVNKNDAKLSSKRKIELSDSDGEESKIIDNKKSAPVFKKRIKTTTSAAPNKDIKHTNIRSDSQDGKDISDIPSEVIKPKSGVKPPPTHIKTLTLTDFQPDVCKDFLQTGYCGYGDTCKFLHVRDDSRQNKPVEKNWQLDQVKNKTAETSKSEPLPFKCVLCKSDYKSPVKVPCGHIYCKECFLNRYKTKKKSSCIICSKETSGIIVPVSKFELAKLTST